MLHVGLDFCRRRLDVCLISELGELVDEIAAAPDADGLRYLTDKVGRRREPVRAVIESMTGARFVHDTLEQLGWDVRIADAHSDIRPRTRPDHPFRPRGAVARRGGGRSFCHEFERQRLPTLAIALTIHAAGWRHRAPSSTLMRRGGPRLCVGAVDGRADRGRWPSRVCSRPRREGASDRRQDHQQQKLARRERGRSDPRRAGGRG